MTQTKFFALASGSNGNCYYLHHNGHGLLIDVGISFRAIKRCFADANLDFTDVRAVIISHEHTDHIRGLYTLTRKADLPIFALPAVLAAIGHASRRTSFDPAQCRHLRKDTPLLIADFRITPFHLPHDSADHAGFLFECDDTRLLIASDVGAPTPQLSDLLRSASHAVLEANYDPHMLANGPYPIHLKQRIRNGHGHLSNLQTADLIRSAAHPNLKHVWLCHLSAVNNAPDAAAFAVAPAIPHGCRLTVLQRSTPSDVFPL